jgi:DNA-binding SARP family transcriptional activator/predicted ATPase
MPLGRLLWGGACAADCCENGAVGGRRLRAAVLDGLEIRLDDDVVYISSPRCRQVMAYLVLRAGQRVSCERLIDTLWGEDPPRSARNSVQRFVSDLRLALGPSADRLETVPGGYRLRLEADDEIDVTELRRRLDRARELLRDGRSYAAFARLDVSAAQQTEPLRGLDGAAFVQSERAGLDELVADSLEVALECRLASGEYSAAVAEARLSIERYPYRERLWLLLGTALARAGRSNEALDRCAQFRRALADDLGLDPSPALQQLEVAILEHDLGVLGDKDARGALLAPSAPRPISRGRREAEAGADGLIGRDADVERVVQLLERHPSVTVVGPGGIGKTVLALAAIEDWTPSNGDVVRFVPLAGVSAAGIHAAIGAVVGVSLRQGAEPIREVLDRIASDVGLLVLDNCDHVAEAVRETVGYIREGAPHVRLLLTSRVPLGVPDESVVRLGPLAPHATLMMFDRCVGHNGLSLDDVPRELIDELCARLDGFPLAVEVAASSLRVIGVRELLARWKELQSSLAGSPGAPERQRTLETVLDSSLELLDPLDSELLSHSAVLPAEFDLDALEAVCEGRPMIDGLGRLVDHGLLQVRRDRETVRYRMLVPLRDHLRARGPTAGGGHCDRRLLEHFLEVVERSLATMQGTAPMAGVDRLRADLSNLRMAFDVAEDGRDRHSMARLVRALGLANGMSPAIQAHTTLRDWTGRLESVLTVERSADDADAWSAVAWGRYGAGDGAWYTQWNVAPERADVATQAMLAVAVFSTGDASSAWGRLGDLDLPSIDDAYLRAMLCGVGAVIAFENGDERAAALTAAASETARIHRAPGMRFFAGLAESTAAFVRADLEAAEETLDRTMIDVTGHGLLTLENMGRAGIAMTLGYLTDRRDPVPILERLVGDYLDQHSLDPASVAMALDVAALVLDRAGRHHDAARLVGLLQRLRLSIAILRPARLALERRIEDEPDLRRARAQGSSGPTIDVLRASHVALAGLAD